MTWEAVGVIVVTLAVFVTVVSGLAWLLWKRLAHLDRQMRGDIRLHRKDKQAVMGEGTPAPWWVK